MSDFADAREIVHVLRTVRDRFPDPTDVLNTLALSYCAWNGLIAEVNEQAVITDEGLKVLGSLGQLYPEGGTR